MLIVTDDKLNLLELGERLRKIRGGRSRREVSERCGVSASYIQKVEEGRYQDLTLSNVGKLADGYEISPLELVTMALSLDTDHVVTWSLSNDEVRQAMERATGRRVVVEAEMSSDVSTRLERLAEQVERLDGMVDRMASLVAVLSSSVVALQTNFERHLGAAVARQEVGEELGDLFGDLGSED